MSTSDFSPDHRALPRIFANPKESQLAEITQLLFQSGSNQFMSGYFLAILRPVVKKQITCGFARVRLRRMSFD